MRQMFSKNQLEKLAKEQITVDALKDLLKEISGYDATKTQFLQNDKGTFKWVEVE